MPCEESALPVVITFLSALAASSFLTPLCRKIALGTGFLAHPSERGVHRQATPLLGGGAVFLAVVLALGAAGSVRGLLPRAPTLGFLAGGALIFVMGVVDDRVDLSWFSKLLGQIVAAVLLMASEDASGRFFLSPFGLVLSLFWMVGLTNALNFLDNMDGICAGISMVVALTMVGLSLLAGRPETAVLAAAVCGASIGFLRFNLHPASIFLGDGGSLFLGYSLASLGLLSSRHLDLSFALLVPVIVLAYPIFDITFVSVTRYARGQSLTQGGKDHTSHRLARVLGGARATVGAVYAICAVLGAGALLLERLSFAPATIVATLAVAFGFLAFGIRLCRMAPVPEPRRTPRAALS